MAIPSSVDIWKGNIQQLATTRTSNQPHTVFNTPSGSGASLESTLLFQVLWDSPTDQSLDNWPTHAIFSDSLLREHIRDSFDKNFIINNVSPPATEASNIRQSLSELHALVAEDLSIFPTQDHIRIIQRTPQLSCFTTFALQLKQINILPINHKIPPDQRPRIVVSETESPAIRLTLPDHYQTPLPTPSKPGVAPKAHGENATRHSSNDTDAEENFDAEYNDDDLELDPTTRRELWKDLSTSNIRTPSLTAKSEQTTVVTIISLLCLLQGLSTKDELLIEAGGGRWIFMGCMKLDLKTNILERKKIWEARADGVISRGGKTVGFIEAKSGERNHYVRYQEAAELVAFVRHTDTGTRDQLAKVVADSSTNETKDIVEEKSHCWVISINGNQIYLLVGSWKQPYLDFLDELPRLLDTTQNDPDQQLDLPFSALNLGDNQVPQSSVATQQPELEISSISSSPNQGTSQISHSSDDSSGSKPGVTQKPRLETLSSTSREPPYTPLNKRDEISYQPASTPPHYSFSDNGNTEPHPSSFLHIDEHGPYNLSNVKDILTFSRLFEYLINCKL